VTTARTSRLDAEVLAEADPTARVSRVDVEALSQAPSKARTSRLDAEVLAQAAAKARLSRLVVEVLAPNMRIYERTGTDTATLTGDVGAGDVAWQARSGSEGLTPPSESVGKSSLLSRTGSDTAPAGDQVEKSVIKTRSATDAVAGPADQATGTVHTRFVRFGYEILAPPTDEVVHTTYITGFRPSFEPPGRRLVQVQPQKVPRSRTTQNWSADVQVSKPKPYTKDRPVMVDFGGFGFTTGGIAHNLCESDAEEVFAPVFAPEEMPDGS
jgi:hypothetical protein